MGPARRRWLGCIGAIGLLAAIPVVGCDAGCDTTLTATAGTAHRTGSATGLASIQVDLSATLTYQGSGVGGVRIGFYGILPGRTPVNAGGAVTGADGVAHYSGPADATLALALTPVTTAHTYSYQAQTQAVGSNPSSHACNLLTTRSPQVDLRYQP